MIHGGWTTVEFLKSFLTHGDASSVKHQGEIYHFHADIFIHAGKIMSLQGCDQSEKKNSAFDWNML